MLLWIFLLGLTFSFIIPAINFYLSERNSAYIFYVLYIIFSIIFILYTFGKYNNLMLFSQLNLTPFYQYERISQTIPMLFYYFFFWYYVLKSSRCALYRRVLKYQIIFTLSAAPLTTITDVLLLNFDGVQIITLLLGLASLLLNYFLVILLFKDNNPSFRIIGFGLLGALTFILLSLIIYSFPGISIFQDNPHKLYLIGMLIELSFFNYALNLSNLQYRESLISEKNDLERSALQAQMNPHFIFNVLNSIQSAITQNEKKHAGHLLAKFSKLIRATLNNARARKISLEEEIAYLESYLYLEKVRHKRGFDYNVTHDNDIDPYDTTIPPMLVQPYVENAIKHGLKNVEKGVIGVNYSTEQNYLVISVTDNGHGFQKDTLKNKEYNSVGMAITQRRLELLADQKDKDKMVTVHHLKASDGRVIGTKIMIRVKIE